MCFEMPDECHQCDGEKECCDCEIRRKWMLNRMGNSGGKRESYDEYA